MCIPPYTEAFLTVDTPKHFNDLNVLLENAERVSCVSVAGALAFCKNNKAICKVLNHNPYVVTLKKGLKLAKILGLDKIAAIQRCEDAPTLVEPELEPEPSRAELDKFHKSFGFQISSSLNEAQRYEALHLLYRHKAVFARDVTEIKQCKAPPLTLELHTDRKCFKRQFRLNEEDKAEITRQIKEMEDVGVIEPSDTPYYNSPIFLVWKKSGKRRLVIDLRGINSLIVPKLVQLPQIEELLDTVTAKKTPFSEFYRCYSGFLAAESRPKFTKFDQLYGP